jgi:hypothetical protein
MMVIGLKRGYGRIVKKPEDYNFKQFIEENRNTILAKTTLPNHLI